MHVDNYVGDEPLLEELKIETAQARGERNFWSVTDSFLGHINTKNPYESFIEENRDDSEGKVMKENYIIKELVSMGFPERSAINLLKHFPIDNINTATEMLLKDKEGWTHQYIPDSDNKCEICGDSYSEHIEKISNPFIFNTDSFIRQSRNESLTSEEANYLNNKEEDAIAMVECEICFCSVNRGEAFNLLCKHAFCRVCFQNYLKEAIENGKVIEITCPEQDCKVLVEDQQVRRICSKELYDKYLKFKKNIKVNLSKQMRWCSRANCGRVIKKRKKARAVCECGFEMCFRCGEAWHGGTSCSKNFERMYKSWAKDKNIQKCPKCKIRVEKDHGCNHMTCTFCKYEWCWICGREYTGRHFESFLFGCLMLQFTDVDWGFGRIFLYLLLTTVFWPFILFLWCFKSITSALCEAQCGNWFWILILIMVLVAAPILWGILLVPTQLYRYYNLFYILNRICID
jgi:hypothetical protein